MLTKVRPTKVTIDVQTGQELGRNGQHRVFGLGRVLARGETLSEAKDAFAETMARIVNARMHEPIIQRDDDGALVVSVNDGTGWVTWRVAPDGSLGGASSSDLPPSASHLERLTPRCHDTDCQACV